MTDFRVLVLAGLAAAVVLGIFLGIQYILERRRAALQRRLREPGAGSNPHILIGATLESRGADATPLAEQPKGWFGRLDSAFEGMIRRTGLDVEPDQALGFIALAAVGRPHSKAVPVHSSAAAFFWLPRGQDLAKMHVSPCGIREKCQFSPKFLGNVPCRRRGPVSFCDAPVAG